MIDTGTKPKRKVYSSRVKFQAVLEVIKGKSVGERIDVHFHIATIMINTQYSMISEVSIDHCCNEYSLIIGY